MKRIAARWFIIVSFLLACGFGIAGALGAAAVLLLRAIGAPRADLSDAGILLIVAGASVAAIVALDKLEEHIDA